MFVEPQPGSGLDRVAPAYLVRRLLAWIGKHDSDSKNPPPAQQQDAAKPATEPGQAGPDRAR